MASTKAVRRDGQNPTKNDIYVEDSLDFHKLGITDPCHDMSRIIQTNAGLSRSLYGWILDSSEFQSWRNGTNRLLWITGESGSGKTAQMCGIIHELQKPTSSTGLLAYFFCQSTDKRSNNGAAVLRGLLYLLIQQQPELLKYVRRKHGRIKRETIENENSWAALEDLFTDSLEYPVLKSRGVCFVLDAVNECTDDWQVLRDLAIRLSSTRTHVKWIVSGGEFPENHQRLQTSGRQPARFLFPSTETVSRVVNSFIKERLRRLADQRNYDSETACAVEKYLIQAHGTILWIELVCRSLANSQQSDILAQLREYPLDVSSFYAYSVRRIKELGYEDTYRNIFAVVATVHRPITLHELSLFMDIPQGSSGVQTPLAEIVQNIDPLLTVHNETIYFVHSSAKTFLLNDLASSDSSFAAWLDRIDGTIVSKSLKAMSGQLRRDIYNLKQPGYTIDQVRRPQPDPLKTVHYSAIFWVDHMCASYQKPTVDMDSDDVLAMRGPVHTFLRENYLYWLEALSLLHVISEGVREMQKLQEFYEHLDTPIPLRDLVRETLQFLVAHRFTIEQAPLQIYASALVFSPAGGLVRELYNKENPHWIVVRPNTFQSRKQGAHGGPVWAVAFSPTDNQIAASASDDTTVKIWNAATGTCIWTLEGHTDYVWSAAFSNDGRNVVSTSDDNAVKIWKIATGQCIQTFDGHGDGAFSRAATLRGHGFWVYEVDFSHNDELIASASEDKSVKIWDSITGECLKTLEHDEPVWCVRFWQNNKVASGSSNGTIKLWDVKSGRCLWDADGGQEARSVVFSHSGQHIAVATSASVNILNVANGKCVRTLQQGDETYSVAYSADDTLIAIATSTTLSFWNPLTGQPMEDGPKSLHTDLYCLALSQQNGLVASGTREGVVRLWDITTGECLHSMHLKSGLRSVAFDRGDQRIVASLSDGISIWSTSTGACLYQLKTHTRDVNCAAPSHDGQQLATASDDCIIKLWDVVYGGSAWSASFSSDGRWLATCSDGGTVKIWNRKTRECYLSLRHHTSAVYSTTFSHNGVLVASASEDRSISISALIGDLVQRLKGHNGSVLALAFSLDDKRIVSSSNDRTVRSWDVSTGMCLQVVDVGTSFYSIRLDDTGSYLHTEVGCIKLGPSLEPPVVSDTSVAGDAVSAGPKALEDDAGEHNYGLSLDRCWVTDNGENVLLLPPEYRPISSAVLGRTICIGCRSGCVYFLDFSIN